MLSTPTAARVAHISYRQLDTWIRSRYVVTVHDPTPGSGHHRALPDQEVLVAHALGQLSRFGILVSSPLAQRLAAHVRLHGLHGTVRDGFLALDLDRLADPIRALTELEHA